MSPCQYIDTTRKATTLPLTVFGRPFVKWFALCYRTIACPVCLSVCNVGVLWPNGFMDQGATWYGDRSRPRPQRVRWGPSSAPKESQQPPLFGPCLLWPWSPISATVELLYILFSVSFTVIVLNLTVGLPATLIHRFQHYLS